MLTTSMPFLNTLMVGDVFPYRIASSLTSSQIDLDDRFIPHLFGPLNNRISSFSRTHRAPKIDKTGIIAAIARTKEASVIVSAATL